MPWDANMPWDALLTFNQSLTQPLSTHSKRGIKFSIRIVACRLSGTAVLIIRAAE